MPAIRYVDTPVAEGGWDVRSELGKVKNGDIAALCAMHAWQDQSRDPARPSTYDLPHHVVSEDGVVGAANLDAVRAALARLETAKHIPVGDKAAARQHLEQHLDKQPGGVGLYGEYDPQPGWHL